MKQQTDTLWTLVELGHQVQDTLAADPLTPRNGRIRAVPDRRTIRYYTTIGLLDRPAAMRGRTALYSKRHLQQLVAIKRLQARGLSLAEVQQALAGLPDEELAALAELPPAASPPTPTHREAFWRTELPEEVSKPEPPEITAADLYHGLTLAPGVTLLLQGGAPLEADDVRALQDAAAPLLDVLRRRQLEILRKRGLTGNA